MIIWGLSWASGKIVAQKSHPSLIMFWRFLISAIGMLPVLWLTHNKLTFSKRAAAFAFLGGFFMAAYNLFFFWGLKDGLAGGGGIIVTTLNPLLTFVVSFLFLRTRLRAREAIGLALGLSGGIILLKVWSVSPEALAASGNIYFLVCALLWSFVTLASSRAATLMSVLVFSFYVNLIAALVILPVAYQNSLFSVFSLDAIFWGNMLFISLVSNCFATTMYFIATRKLGSRHASSFLFLVPTCAMAGAMIFLGEKPDIFMISGGILALSAVYVINR